MSRRGSRSTLKGALTKGDRGSATLTVISAAMALGGLLLTHVVVLTLVGLLLFIFGCMGLVQAIALALGSSISAKRGEAVTADEFSGYVTDLVDR